MNSPFPFISFFPNHDFPCTKPHAKSWTCSKLEKTNINKSRKQKTHSNPEWFCLTHLRCIYINTNISIYTPCHHHTPHRPWAWNRPIFWPSPTNVAWAHHHPTFPRPELLPNDGADAASSVCEAPSQQHTSLKFGLVIFEIHVEKKRQLIYMS